jgi:hypothetical protein
MWQRTDCSTATSIDDAVGSVSGSSILAADERLLPVFLAVAGDAALASLADTPMPDAYREGGLIAFVTAAGFLLFTMENA